MLACMVSLERVHAFAPKPISIASAFSSGTNPARPSLFQETTATRNSIESLYIPMSKTQLFAGWDNDRDENNVKTTEMNVDATTLTAVGFAAIAFNFLVLANMGDGGIAGIVARIINTWG